MSYFYNKTFKNLTTSMLNLFNDIQVKRLSKAGATVATISVPIMLGPIEKQHGYKLQDESDLKFYLQLPRMSLVPTGVQYAANRVRSSNESREFYDEQNSTLNDISTFISDAEPAPYDFGYTLFIRTESIDDFSQIIEQILPYWNPSRYLRIKEFATLNIERNVKVILQGGVNLDFTIEQQENARRAINGTLSFLAEGFMYLPSDTTRIIKTIISKYHISNSTTDDLTLSASNYLTEDYYTSGVEATSAGAVPTSALPDPSSYETSGYSPETNIYWFSTANSYNV